MNPTPIHLSGLEILAPVAGRHAEVLSPEACAFLAGLFEEFGPRRLELLARRAGRQAELEAGKLPDFLPETRAIREGEWQVPPPPPDLIDRRTEITGPVERKMVVNALNSGAQCYMADLEDATSPTWENVVGAQVNLIDAVRRQIDFVSPEGKSYALHEKTSTLLVRPRGWHLPEKHVRFAGEPVSASLFDWGLYFFHNARELVARGTGPYFYLPKMESHLEARLWNDVFLHAQAALGLPAGTVRATALIETILASFEAEEILHELSVHALGLNCGRWDYIFSCIKKLCHRGELYPERSQLTMESPFLRAYCRHVIDVCHRRGAYAMGGMSAQVPIPGDPAANAEAFAQVRIDKEREVADGFDGTWISHPAFVAVALEPFSRKPPRRPTQRVSRDELLAMPEGTIREEGVRLNLRIGVQYVAAWLGGLGCVPLEHRMEDAATAEISRSQLWQWLHYGASLEDGRPVTAGMYKEWLPEELARLPGDYTEAAELFLGLVLAPRLAEFLTLPAYERLE